MYDFIMESEQSQIEILLYEPWMKKQVALLFENEYKISSIEFEGFMSRLYEHPYQINKSIKIVAVHNEKIVGFQSFFFWPYTQNGKTFNSFQSGNSLVHPEYRGKRLFARMLNYLADNPPETPIDFLMGFPVQESYNSFLKNGWENIFDLQWFVKVINPFAFLFSTKKLTNYFKSDNNNNLIGNNSSITLSENKDFRNWKNQLVHKPNIYFQFEFEKNGGKIIFDLKIQRRKHIIRELIIGSIRFNDSNSEVLEEAVASLISKIKKVKCVTVLSFAGNESFKKPNIIQILVSKKFKKINRKIYFIIMPFLKFPLINDPCIWNIGRADIDTW
jgi:hypothetical protein